MALGAGGVGLGSYSATSGVPHWGGARPGACRMECLCIAHMRGANGGDVLGVGGRNSLGEV